MIPWWKAEEIYAKAFKLKFKGGKEYSIRLTLVLFIFRIGKDTVTVKRFSRSRKTCTCSTLIGFPAFKEAPFHHPLVIHLRKRLGANIINELNEWIFMEEKNADLIMKMMTKEPRLQASISKTRPCEDEKN
jgi:IS5 family transposase